MDTQVLAVPPEQPEPVGLRVERDPGALRAVERDGERRDELADPALRIDPVQVVVGGQPVEATVRRPDVDPDEPPDAARPHRTHRPGLARREAEQRSAIGERDECRLGGERARGDENEREAGTRPHRVGGATRRC